MPVTALDAYLKPPFDPDDAVLFGLRGELCARLEKYGRAIDDFTRALNMDTLTANQAVALLNGRGWARFSNRNLHGAHRDFEHVLLSQSSIDDPAVIGDAHCGRGLAGTLIWREHLREYAGSDNAQSPLYQLADDDARQAYLIARDTVEMVPTVRAELFYKVARIYASLATSAEQSLFKDRTEYHNLRERWRRASLMSLKASLEVMDREVRSAFWNKYVQHDPEFNVLRNMPEFSDVEAELVQNNKVTAAASQHSQQTQ